METNGIIKDLLHLLKQELNLLTKKKKILIFDQYRVDIEEQHIVERAFVNAIQACIDIGARLISKKDFRKADSYHDIFEVLLEEKIILPALNRYMKELVGFRNALTHEYRRIKHEEVFRHLQESLIVLNSFARAIVKYIG